MANAGVTTPVADPTDPADADLAETGAPGSVSAASGRQLLLTGVALLAVAVLGLARLADPFHGDQSLFLQYAQALDAGEALYLDRWDQKQPGVFGFYWLAVRLFGASEIGVHLLELLYLLAFSVVLVVALRGWLRVRMLAAVAPVAVIGTYYAVTGTWHLTQAEWLVAFPIFVALWLAAAPWPTPRSRRVGLFLSGIAAGIAVTFKLAFAPIVIVGWALTLWTATGPLTIRGVIVDRVLPAFAGGLAVVAVVGGWLAATGALPDAIWTAIAYPLALSAEADGAPVARLARSAGWFALVMAPWLVLAAAAGVRWRGRRAEWMTIQLAAWVVTAAIVIVVQRFSWWEYHFTLLMAPVAILALRGADGIIVAVRASSQRAVAVGLCALILAVPLVIGGVRVALAGFAPLTVLASIGDPDAVLDYQRGVRDAYDEVWEDTSFLRDPDALPGPIYVFGNPLFLHLGQRTQAIPIHGFSWELSIGSQWSALAGQLAEGAPAYVFVDQDVASLIEDRSPETLGLLSSAYVVLREGRDGVWYQRR